MQFLPGWVGAGMYPFGAKVGLKAFLGTFSSLQDLVDMPKIWNPCT